ncbi:hypothetical protein FRC11_000494, partial [Ceratobasidium sp. 423]
ETGIPIKPPQGVVELYDSIEWIRRRHMGLGLLHLNKWSPYARPSIINDQQTIFASRMLTWERDDYGSVSDEQRQRNRADIPQDIEDFISIMHAKTSAEFYIIAGWSHNPTTYQFYDAASLHSEAMLEDRPNDDWNGGIARDRFLEYQLYHNANIAYTNFEDGFPWIYAMFDGSFRPVLPLMHFNNRFKLPIWVAFFDAQWEWQGGTLPVQFENGDEDVDEDKRVVNSMRLPDSVRYFLHPSKWEGDDYALWEDHLWCGQKLYLPRHRRFQYSWLRGANGEIFFDDIREDMAPESRLRYDGSARIFTARLLRNAKNDDLAREERMFNMPFAPEHLDTDSFWDEETIQEVAAHCHDESIMLKLVEELTRFEATGPIQATRGKWKQYQELHPEFAHDCPENDLSIDAIGGWWLPPIYFPAKRRREAQLALADLSEFVRGRAMRHETTNTMLAGRYGKIVHNAR